MLIRNNMQCNTHEYTVKFLRSYELLKGIKSVYDYFPPLLSIALLVVSMEVFFVGVFCLFFLSFICILQNGGDRASA